MNNGGRLTWRVRHIKDELTRPANQNASKPIVNVRRNETIHRAGSAPLTLPLPPVPSYHVHGVMFSSHLVNVVGFAAGILIAHACLGEARFQKMNESDWNNLRVDEALFVCGRNCISSTNSFCRERLEAQGKAQTKLQALVHDIVPPTTATADYIVDLEKLSANEQFFDEAQTAVRLQQTTEIISDVSFITDHIAYASTNKTKLV